MSRGLHHPFLSMLIRRAEVNDIQGIKQLIKGGFGRDDMEKALRRRYGDTTNLQNLMYNFIFDIVIHLPCHLYVLIKKKKYFPLLV